jgi:hypothetical protein
VKARQTKLSEASESHDIRPRAGPVVVSDIYRHRPLDLVPTAMRFRRPSPNKLVLSIFRCLVPTYSLDYSLQVIAYRDRTILHIMQLLPCAAGNAAVSDNRLAGSPYLVCTFFQRPGLFPANNCQGYVQHTSIFSLLDYLLLSSRPRAG